jgi:hypothetical protein
VTIGRLRDAGALGRVLERDDIAPLVDGFDPVAWLADRRNVALIDDHGDIALFERTGKGVFEGHTLFASRGREAIETGRTMLAAMFDMYGARAIWGRTPIERPAARWFSRRLGFRSLGVVETVRGPCELFYLGAEQCRF